jgi:hypothetical protein
MGSIIVTLRDAPRGSESGTMRRLRNPWLNATMASVMILFMSLTIISTIDLSGGSDNGPWRYTLIALVTTASVCVFGSLSTRAVRIGVFGRPDGMHVRGLFTTKIVPWEPVVATSVKFAHDVRGSNSYTPVVIVSSEFGDRMIVLSWLAALTQTTGERRASQVNAMVAEARSEWRST